MIKITKQMLESTVKGVSITMPEEFHNKIKAEAALLGKTKDKLFLELLQIGCENYQEAQS